MKFFNALIILVILILGYTGYWLYKDNQTSNYQIPEHLTKKFWENVTPDVLREKLKTITNVNEVRPDTKQNMLHLLVLYGKYPEMVGLLVNAGVAANLRDDNMEDLDFWIQATPLLYSIDRSKEWIKEILQYNKSVDETVLFNHDDGNNEPVTTLFVAVHYRAPIEIIRLFLKAGANPNFQTERKKLSVLMAAVIPTKEGDNSIIINSDLIQLLLDYKADIALVDAAGKTALDYMRANKEFSSTELFKKLMDLSLKK